MCSLTLIYSCDKQCFVWDLLFFPVTAFGPFYLERVSYSPLTAPPIIYPVTLIHLVNKYKRQVKHFLQSEATSSNCYKLLYQHLSKFFHSRSWNRRLFDVSALKCPKSTIRDVHLKLSDSSINYFSSSSISVEGDLKMDKPVFFFGEIFF